MGEREVRSSNGVDLVESMFKITFNLGNGKDIHDISRCTELTDEERDYIDWLGVGQVIVSLKGRVQVPLHVAFPRVGVRKGMVGDNELLRR